MTPRPSTEKRKQTSWLRTTYLIYVRFLLLHHRWIVWDSSHFCYYYRRISRSRTKIQLISNDKLPLISDLSTYSSLIEWLVEARKRERELFDFIKITNLVTEMIRISIEVTKSYWLHVIPDSLPRLRLPLWDGLNSITIRRSSSAVKITANPHAWDIDRGRF